jgi:hypothetical protein
MPLPPTINRQYPPSPPHARVSWCTPPHAAFGNRKAKERREKNGNPPSLFLLRDDHQQARKAAQFVQLASKRRVPLLFLHHVRSVEEGAVRPGSGTMETATMMHAVACSRVPKLSLVVGDSIG